MAEEAEKGKEIMPLKKGFSKDSIGKNIKKEEEAGKPKDQAEAIALNTAREAADKAGEPEKGPKPKRNWSEWLNDPMRPRK